MKIYLTFILFISMAMAQDTVPEKEIEIELGIDQIEKVDFAYSTKVQVGNEGIIDLILAPQKREITFRGKKEGKTSITVRDSVGEIRQKYIVNIKGSANAKTVSELKEFLGQVEGLDIGVKGGKVVVGGHIVVPTDIGLVATILPKYPDVINIVELSPQTQRIIAKKIKDELNRNGLRDVSVRVVNQTFWLEGVVGSDGQKSLAVAIANAYMPDGIQSLMRNADAANIRKRDFLLEFISVNEKKQPPPAKKMVKVTAQFVELTKNYTKIFGFQWAPLMNRDNSKIEINRDTDGTVNTNSSNTISATISALFPRLQSAKNAGYARIIQSGVVITQDQMAANIKKNDVTTYTTGAGETQRDVSVTTGFTMDVTPKILDQERVELGVGLNVSMNKTITSGTQNTPSNATNEIKTNLVVKSKESAVLGGVVQGSEATDYDKGNLLGNPPENTYPLFNLIRKKDFNNQKTQYVMFITPEIIASASDGAEEIRKKFRKRSR
ncbi:MAG: pilus assembly protein N-terminal domain-containing protein [Bacteriovoracaceae bacterium]|nr:pilus assembly protein N-terminal domain-containing protein [Bacteriovoracaceae bacterium]